MSKIIGLRNGGVGGVNPKDKIGATKIDLTVVSPIAIAHCAFAMMDGADKYGEYNWRVEPILARTYIAASIRHQLDWLDGQEYAEDSLAHHLAHSMACCAILLDAIHQKQLVDDRLIQTEEGDAFPAVLEQLNAKLRERNAKKAERVLQQSGPSQPELKLDVAAFLGITDEDRHRIQNMSEAERVKLKARLGNEIYRTVYGPDLEPYHSPVMPAEARYPNRPWGPAGHEDETEHQVVLDAIKEC